MGYKRCGLRFVQILERICEDPLTKETCFKGLSDKGGTTIHLRIQSCSPLQPGSFLD